MNIPNHISESLATIFGVKYLNSLMRIRWKKFGSGIRHQHPYIHPSVSVLFIKCDPDPDLDPDYLLNVGPHRLTNCNFSSYSWRIFGSSGSESALKVQNRFRIHLTQQIMILLILDTKAIRYCTVLIK
jgi:hypothetical protein